MAYTAENKKNGYIVLNAFKSHYSTPLSVDELAKKISSGVNFISILGYTYQISEITPDEMNSAMRKLAQRATAGIPDSSSFFDAIKAEMDSTFMYVVKYTATEVTKELGDIADNYMSFSKFILKNGPYILLFFGGLYAYGMYKKVTSS